MAYSATKHPAKPDPRLGQLRSQIETLEDEVKAVAGDVEGIADHRVREVLRKAEDAAHNAYRLAEETVTHLAHDVDGWASDNANMARTTIRNRPLLALVLSVGAGALVGALVARR